MKKRIPLLLIAAALISSGSLWAQEDEQQKSKLIQPKQAVSSQNEDAPEPESTESTESAESTDTTSPYGAGPGTSGDQGGGLGTTQDQDTDSGIIAGPSPPPPPPPLPGPWTGGVKMKPLDESQAKPRLGSEKMISADKPATAGEEKGIIIENKPVPEKVISDDKLGVDSVGDTMKQKLDVTPDPEEADEGGRK